MAIYFLWMCIVLAKLRLRSRARLTILVLGFLMLCLSLVAWWALHQTQRMAADLQSRTVIDITTAMGLSEQVAQIAALAPYVGESALPFQLQTEREQLEARFLALDARVEELSDPAVKAEIQSRIAQLRTDLGSLTALVRRELFVREDLLVIHFELDDWVQRHLANRNEPEYRALAGMIQMFRHTLTTVPNLTVAVEDVGTRSRDQVLEQLIVTDMPSAARDALLTPIDQSVNLLQDREVIAVTKNLLFANNRAQSEGLTDYVEGYVADVQATLATERQALEQAVQHARWGIILVSVLGALALLEGVRFMFRATRDLQTVTQDMTQLAEGETGDQRPSIARQDEIGELARTFDVFREASLRMTWVNSEMQTQTQLLETVLNSINDGLSVFSEAGQLLAWNPRYLELFGLSSRLVRRGMALDEVQALMDRDSFRTFNLEHEELDVGVLAQLRQTQPQTFERHYDNGKVIEFRSEPMPGGGFVTLHSDLTGRRAVEQQLVQSQKMEMLGQLTGGVAHDFNNLLSALIGNLQLLEASDQLPSRERHFATRALGVAERGAHLVERLLAFSRKQQLHPEPVDVGGLLEGMLDLVEYSVAPNVTVHLDLNDRGCAVWVDPSQLENAILNLAINSSAAMPHGGDLWLVTRYLEHSDTEPQIEVEVRDSGTGMTEELMNRIWEPFYTTKPVGQGSGLGLSLVYGFIKQSGGDVLLESDPGRGTCIRLYLPVHQGTEIPVLPDQFQLPPRVEVKPNQKVVLVEDDLSVRRVLRDTFRSLGILIHAFHSAEEALQWLKQDGAEAAAVLSDINLAGELSGVQLAQLLKELHPNLTVILTSGLPREHLRQHFGLADTMPL
ncbi:MAG: PAS-domain containing protein, partial [Natronospirillum sp.]